jgi:sulfate transport system permease protein
LGVVMLAFSLVLLVLVSVLQRWTRRWAEQST